MSGNVKLACNVLDYRNVGPNEFETEIRYAKLLPLSSSLYQHKVEAELTGGSWEYDLKKFYHVYNDVFFEPYFNYNKGEILKLDKTTNQYTRNTDFEMGVKRVSYVKNGCQFAFFAPFYFEGIDDLPKYFYMSVHISTAVHHIVKNIKINITDNAKSVRNYLYHYLTRYAKSIDSNVCFMLPDSKQATYYGIDLTRGGFVKCVDNGVSNLYTTQTTINNFDATLCTGFKRNKMVMKQVMPLAFYFNIDDLLTPAERNLYRNGNVEFSGYYVNQKNIGCSWYDFNIDYDLWKESVLALNTENGLMQWFPGNIHNIMDASFPSLNDMRYVEYQFSNKLTTNYCRWKLKYSSDEHPFITNMSTAFSKNQNSNYKYGQYPVSFSSMDGLALPMLSNSAYYYNLIFPLSSNTKLYDVYNASSTPKYQNIFNNYCLNWFNVIDKVDDSLFKQENLWQNVVDNCVYYNGILYDLSNIYYELVEPEKIDKFAMFVKINSNFMNEQEIGKLKFANYMLNRQVVELSLHPNALSNLQLLNWGVGDKNEQYKNYLYENEEYTGAVQDNANKDSLEFNRIFTYSENNTGKYINLADYDMDYYELNKYYDYDKVSAYINNLRNNFFDDYQNVLSSSYSNTWDPAFRDIIKDNAFVYMGIFNDPSSYMISSYEILPINRSYMISYCEKIDINTYAYMTNLNMYTTYDGRYNTISYVLDEFNEPLTYIGHYTKNIPVLDKDNNQIYDTYNATYIDANGDVQNMYTYVKTDNTYMGIQHDIHGNVINEIRYKTYTGVKESYSYVQDCNGHILSYLSYCTYTGYDPETYEETVCYVMDKKYETDENGCPIQTYNNIELDADNIYEHTATGELVRTPAEHLTCGQEYVSYATYYEARTYTSYYMQPKNITYIGRETYTYIDSNYVPQIGFYTYIVPKQELCYEYRYEPFTYTVPRHRVELTDETYIGYYTYANDNIEYIGCYYKPIEEDEDEFQYMRENLFYVDNDNYGIKKPSFISYYNSYTGNVLSYFSCGKYEYLHALYGSTFYTKRRTIRASELRRLEYEPFHQTYLRAFCSNDYTGQYEYGWINDPTHITYKLYKSCQHTQELAASLINAYLASNIIYEFNPVLHNNGEVYTSNVFKKRYENTGKFYGAQVAYSEVKNDKNVLYASRYNLNAIFKHYSGVLSYSYFTTYTDTDGTVLKDYYEEKHTYTYDWVYDIATSTYQCAYEKKYNIPYMVSYYYDNIENTVENRPHYEFNSNNYTELYCKFLNKRHIYYWYGELVKDEALKLPENWHIDWKKNIFIKRRVLVHTGNGLSVQDEFVPLVEAGYLFAQRVDPEWFLSFKKFYANILEDTTKGLYYFAGCEGEKFELVYKDIFFRVNKTLWDIIGCEDVHYKDIYLYRIETPLEYDQNYLDANIKTQFINYNTWNSYSSRYSDLDVTLTPMFYDIFEQNELDEAIYANYKLHNISKVEYSWPELDAQGNHVKIHYDYNYRYNANDTLYMISITDDEREKFGMTKTYEEYSYCGSDFSIEVNSLNYNDSLKMSTYKDENGVNYGFYVIQANIDNTSNTFRIDAQTSMISKSSIREMYDYINNINAIYYINGVNIVENKEYGKLLFKNYVPFMNLNLLSNLNNISTVIKPNSFNIDMIYKQQLIDNTNGSYEINLSMCDPNKITKQNLFRYTHNIVPYITERNILSNYYYLKLKDVEKTLLIDGKFNSIGDSPIYKKTIYIDSFTPLNVYTLSPNEKEVRSFNNVSYKYTPLEYKHFNMSKYINVEAEFFIRLDGKYKYHELHELESEEHTISVFAGYMNTGRVTKFTDDEILFLYRKYKVEYDTKSIGLDYSRTEKLYTLTYKFSLL